MEKSYTYCIKERTIILRHHTKNRFSERFKIVSGKKLNCLREFSNAFSENKMLYGN